MVKPLKIMAPKSPPILFMLICAFVLCGLLSPTKASIADTSYVNGRYNHPYLKLADSLAAKNEPYMALEAFQSSLEKFKQENNYRGQITAACKMAGLYIDLNKFNEAESSLAKALQSFENIPLDSTFLADIYYRLGVLHHKKNQPDSAVIYHHRALNIRKSHIGEYSDPVASSYIAIADIHRYTFFDYIPAEKYYLKALEIRTRDASEGQEKKMANLCYNLATTFRLKGDHDKAITYAYQALNFYKTNDGQDYLYFSLCQNVLATTFLQKSQYRQSLRHFFNAIGDIQNVPSYSGRYLPTFYTNLGVAFIELDQPDSALIYFDQALLILEKTSDSVQMAHTFQQMGVAHLKKQSDLAFYYYQKSMGINQKIFGDDHFQTASNYLDFAKYYESVHEYEKAIDYIKKSLTIMEYEQLLPNVQDQFVPDVNLNAILEGLGMLSSCQAKLYYKHHEIEYLERAFENYLVIDHILSNYRNQLARESSRLNLAKDFKDTYEEALNCAYALYQRHPSKKVADGAFRFMEKNKALVLMDFLRHAELNNTLGIPDSLRSLEQFLEAQLNFYTAELSQSTGEEAVADLHAGIFSVERQLENFRNNLVKNHPEYYKIKYANKFLSLPECRTYLRKKDAVMIEYFYGDSYLYVLAIKPEAEGVDFYRMDKPKELEASVEGLLQKLHGDFDMDNMEIDFHEYTQSAFQLYQSLLEPMLTDIGFMQKNRNLIIVPDGVLSFVPFEALVVKKPTSGSVNYKNLSYLVHQFTVSYSFSAQVLMEDKRNDYPDNTLVFSYAQDEKGEPSLGSSLKGTSQEADFIAALIPAKVFSGKEATKSNFKQQVKKAGIIHLALHGRADRLNPMKGAILFRGEGGETMDESLYYYELLQMEIEARLAVLSACETGLGKHQDGEGVFHLARGFRYAGCPTLVASLWRIDDRSTAGIVKGFYREMVLDKNLSLALSESKRQYINNSDELLAHPRYWAGMLLIGDTDPLVLGEPYPSWYQWLLGMLFLPLALLIFLKFKKFVPGIETPYRFHRFCWFYRSPQR